MALQITLVKAPPAVSMAKTSHVFDKRGGTLGRSESNLWVLPDLEKFLSSCHCELLFEAGGYFLLDLSTNGTFLNSAFEPIGKGSKMPLKNGDVFDVGEYRFSVELIDDQPFGFSSPQAPIQPSVIPVMPDDLFGGGAGAGLSSNPFGNGDPLVSDFSSGLAESQDPLAAFDRANNKGKTNDIFGKSSPFGPASTGFDANVEKSHFSTSNLNDSTAHVDQAIVWPSSSRENLIPDDWEDDDLMGKGSNSQLSDDPFDIPAFEVPKPVVPRPKNNDFVGGDAAIVKPQPIPTPVPPMVEAPKVEIKVPPKPVVPQVESRPLAEPAKRNDILITALGLNPDSMSTDEINEISEKVGLLMREITEGMMQVLRSRTNIKNEFRMSVTTIQPTENNPLKFSVGVDDAMENMFIKKTNAYKKPGEAFREGFQEIGEHQVAMIAGIRHGFEKMMERFNPANLEAQFNKQGKGTVIPGMQKAKYWTNYKDHYESYSDNMESSFQHLFGTDFVAAYEEQLRKLANVRRKNKS